MKERVCIILCECDSIAWWLLVELEAEVIGRLTLFAWPLVSQKNLWEDASNSRARGSRSSLSLSCSFFPPSSLPVILSSLFLISYKYLLKSQNVETPEGSGLMTWYDILTCLCAHVHTYSRLTKAGVDATTRTHTCRLRLGSDTLTNKNSSRCHRLHLPPLSSFHLVLSNLSTLPSSLHPSSVIPFFFFCNCLHPSPHPRSSWL